MTTPALDRLFFPLAAALVLSVPRPAAADTVTDWNEIAVKATKGFDGSTGAGVVLDSNLSSRIEAIAARAVFDAVNAIDHFSPGAYHYRGAHTGSAAAAAAQAAHDVLVAELPGPAADARWAQVSAWLDRELARSLAALGVPAADGGVTAGRAAAAAATAARALDGAGPVTTYGAALLPESNPGLGLWRQSNAAAGFVDPRTGAPTGFDGTGAQIQGRPGIDLNWRDVTPFGLTTAQKVALVADVPRSPEVGSPEYARELAYVKAYGQDASRVRGADQLAQALFYKQDAEIFVNEAARLAARSLALSLDDDAALFALVATAVADARIAAFDSKYEQKFWRPISALNAAPDGAVTNGHADSHPVAATPAHPSNTAGHSATGAAGFTILRAFFGDRICVDGSAVTLGTLPWLVGTNNGTGRVTTRRVSTFTQAQLENGASRIYLGVHFGFDNLQGQLLGMAVAEAILHRSSDPATARVPRHLLPLGRRFAIVRALLAHPDLYGYFGEDTRTDD